MAPFHAASVIHRYPALLYAGRLLQLCYGLSAADEPRRLFAGRRCTVFPITSILVVGPADPDTK